MGYTGGHAMGHDRGHALTMCHRWRQSGEGCQKGRRPNALSLNVVHVLCYATVEVATAEGAETVDEDGTPELSYQYTHLHDLRQLSSWV